MIDQMNQDLGKNAIEIIDDVHSAAGIRTDRVKKTKDKGYTYLTYDHKVKSYAIS